MADMDLGLDLDLGLEGEGEEKLEMEGMEGLETEEVKVALAEDLDGFARGFTAAWDLEPPPELLK